MLLDDHGLVAGFMFPDYSSAITVMVTIPVAVSRPYSYTDRAHSHATSPALAGTAAQIVAAAAIANAYFISPLLTL